jgi:Cu(I)/Ag(I) efflux system membrane fusion protein
MLALSACRAGGRAGAPPAAFEGGGLHVEVSLPEGPARQGANALHLRVRDGRGAAVDGAKVSVGYSMAMAGMAPMGGQVAAEAMGHGEYRAPLALDMSGTWQLEVEVAGPGGSVARARGSLRTGADALRLEGDAAPVPARATETRREVRIDPARLQQIGVRFASAERAPLTRTLRASGAVVWDETRQSDVTLRVRGQAREVFAGSVGSVVRAGDPLFSLYSPELYAAQGEYLAALRTRAAGHAADAAERADAIVRAARARLRLLELAEADIDALAARGTPLEAVPIRARSSGFVVEKDLLAGGGIEPGARLFRIAQSDPIWIDAQVFESDAALLAVGQRVRVHVPGQPGVVREAAVGWILPSVDAGTRTARARIELANADLALRPGMWAEVELESELGPRLTVPASAVIYAGARRVVFVDRGEGRLEPRKVETGITTPEVVEIVSGLEPGERVVASGNFLIAAEARLESALEQW